MNFELTEKQIEALECMKSGKNVFLTGPAGTGKSYLLKYFIFWFELNKMTQSSKIFITSTTGLSAILINGMTINRYAGFGIADKDVDYYYKRILKIPSLRKRWYDTKVLIIDEISMMDAETFDKLETLARKIKKSIKPFGGIQLILSGDFLQLKPVKSDNFCFEAFSWNTIDKTFYFNEILRQTDNDLQDTLNKIRIGIVDNDVKELLDACLNKELNISNNITPTLLFPKKDMVVNYNITELNKLVNNGNISNKYTAKYLLNNKPLTEQIYKDLVDSQFQVDDIITIALHSQVMLIVNIPENNLANGSTGIVIDFTKDSFSYPVVLFSNGVTLILKPHDFAIEEGSNTVIKQQVPLMLSWAITIHKAQGMTLDYIRTDIGSNIFEYGQAYVVLSRIKDIKGLSLINIDYSKIKAHPKVLEYYNKL